MTDRTIDQQLELVVEAIVETTPEPPTLGGPRRRGGSPISFRAAAWGFAVAIAIGGVAMILLPRGASRPSTLTTVTAGTQPFTSDRTETTEAGAARRCSGQEPEIDEIPQMDLPIGVAETRNALFASATTCDFASLDAIASEGPTPFDYGYQSAASPGAFWSALEDRGRRVMALLTYTLNRPYTVQRSGDGDIYVWPEPYEDGVGRLPWRPIVEIAEDGEWLSFVIPQKFEIPDDLTLDPAIAMFIPVLNQLHTDVSSFLARADEIENDWQNSLASFPDTRDALTMLEADITAWEASLADRTDVPTSLESSYEAFVEQASHLPGAAAAILLGLEAPDEGTQRRTALAAFRAMTDELHQAIDAMLT